MSNSPVNHIRTSSEVIDLPIPESTLSLAQREALTRVLESATFRKSPRLREFLEFVGTRTLDGDGESISEQQIGQEVFQRGPEFNPAENNIVRATARALRTKLREYYDSEGASDHYRIEIPKGSYGPHFRPIAADATSFEAIKGTTVATVPPRNLGRALILGLAACLLILLIAYLAMENQRLRASIAAVSPEASVLSRVLAPGAIVTIVASDALHRQLQASEGLITSLDNYASKGVFRSPGALAKAPQLFDVIRALPLTNGDDVRAAVQLARGIGSDADVRLVHARNVGMNTFQRGGDFILVAGRRANPWVALFEKGLQFEMVFPSASATPVFRNLHPKRGEFAEYRAKSNDSQNGIAYGRVAILPGLYGSGRVVLIAGTTGESTFAATDFLTRPRGLHEVEKMLGREVDTGLSRLEVLLETVTTGGSTKDYRIAAIR